MFRVNIGLRAFIGGAGATLLIYGVTVPGLLDSYGFVTLFIASLVAGAITSRRVLTGASGAFASSSILIVITSLISWLGILEYNRILMAPFIFFNSFFIASSGVPQEVFVFAVVLIVAAIGGALGSLILRGSLLLIYGEKEETKGQLSEVDRLTRRLDMLGKENEKLEEELRVCDIIEQGAKTRIARNEMTQNDYESIVYNNDNYRAKLRGRMEKVGSEISQLKLDIEARKKAKEDDKKERPSTN